MSGLRLEHVSHAFGARVVVDDVSFHIESGQVVCLVGPSGCGKTTTLRIAAGLEKLQAGRVKVNDVLVGGDGISIAPESRSVGLVFQDYALFPHLRVMENVLFGLNKIGNRKLRRSAALNILQKVGLENLKEAYPHMLSGGEQQRVALARAIAPKPAIMLLDEPFSGLDTGLRDYIREDTLAILKEMGAATLLVTHDPEEALRIGDRILLMQNGRVIQEGSPEQIYKYPNGYFSCSFFGKPNLINGVVKKGKVSSPFGNFRALGFKDESKVNLLIRPEAIKLYSDAHSNVQNIKAEVISLSMLGAHSLVSIRIPPFGSVFESRITGIKKIRTGSTCFLKVDESQVFIFAKQN